MFLRLLLQSFVRQRRRKLMAGIAVVLGVSLITAMIDVGTAVGDKMSAELRTLGANIIVYPIEDSFDVQIGGLNLKPASDGAYLNEADLIRLKQIFWSHNIRGFAPMLESQVPIGGSATPVPIIGTYFAHPFVLPGREFVTGVTKTHPWWNVTGTWPSDSSRDVLLGARLAQRLGFKPGDLAYIADRETKITGILSTGGSEDDSVIAPLGLVQSLIGRPGAVRRVYVSALTKPEDDFARRDPKTMSPEMLERWSCSPYANSIAYQISEVIPGARAEQIRVVAQNEGIVLSRISGLMLLIAVAALIAAALVVSASVATTMFERTGEIALMRSLGANRSLIGTLLFSEAAILGLVGGSLSFVVAHLLARRIGLAVFQAALEPQLVLLPIAVLLAVALTSLASADPILRALRLPPSNALRGGGL